MSDKKLRKRSEIPEKDKWTLYEIYPDESKWEEDLEWCIKEAESLASFKGKIAESKENLLTLLEKQSKISQKLESLYAYAHMSKDADNKVSKYQAMDSKAQSAYAKFAAACSFVQPEILSAPEGLIMKFVDEEPKLEVYRFMLADMLREKEHVLSAAEENILAQLSEATGAPSDIYDMLTDAEMKFGSIVDADGDTVEVTHGNYIPFVSDYNRDVRKSAYTNLYETYKQFINTISTGYNYSVKEDVVYSRVRKYPSARNAHLSSGNIPEEVYDNLIDVVHEYLPVMHKYVELRKKLLAVDKLQMYDVYVPIINLPEKKYSFEEAVKICEEGLKPMGEEYLKNFDMGINSGWIDKYENEGKTSGAYSYGTYGNKPYILLNFNESLDNVFTLVHEMGHSLHSYYTGLTQPYIYSGHSIFTAEVASTVNESLLMRSLLANEKDETTRLYLINHYIDQFKGTLFRQTMFAEFERETHKMVENGEVLTADWLCDYYEKLNAEYFGPAMEKDDLIRYEWARIPHFYRDFYVYQYATGFSAATAISKKILDEGESARNAYIEFLKSGSSDYPVELLKIAGVDMSKPEPVRLAMETFKSLVEELDAAVNK